MGMRNSEAGFSDDRLLPRTTVNDLTRQGERKMGHKDYNRSFTANATAREAFEKIVDVAGWWTASFKGAAGKVNDVFEVTFGKTKVNFKVIEAVPYKKLVWLVTDCHLDWLKDKTEWKGTRILWEISENDKSVKIGMTHLGLVPGMECYESCEEGWNQYAGESLPKLIAAGN
jgi:Activator of Hsp90 ATPase homolog 1-like protein